MDINLLRTVITTVSFLAFVALVLWAYSKPVKTRFDEAAMLPFADDERLATLVREHSDR